MVSEEVVICSVTQVVPQMHRESSGVYSIYFFFFISFWEAKQSSLKLYFTSTFLENLMISFRPTSDDVRCVDTSRALSKRFQWRTFHLGWKTSSTFFTCHLSYIMSSESAIDRSAQRFPVRRLSPSSPTLSGQCYSAVETYVRSELNITQLLGLDVYG